MKIQIPGVTEELVREKYFHGLVPREDLPELLKKQGDFLLRITEPQKGLSQCVVLSVLWNADLPVSKSVCFFSHLFIYDEFR